MNDDASDWVAPVFPDEEIPQILASIHRCLAGFQKTHPLEYETSLSKRLLKRLRRDTVLRDRPVWPDRETAEDDDESDEEGRLDFRFLLLNAPRNPPPYFAIEAKRLHVTFESGWKSLVPEYVTHRQGMMCFIDGRYSKGLHAAGMLGYVFDGDIAKAAALISEQLLAKHAKLRALPPHKLVPSRDFHPNKVWITRHQIDERQLTLYHVLAAV